MFSRRDLLAKSPLAFFLPKLNPNNITEPSFKQGLLLNESSEKIQKILEILPKDFNINLENFQKLVNQNCIPQFMWPITGKINYPNVQKWYQNGKLHRDNDQPAIIRSDGSKEWYQNGKLHRDNDQPAIICSNGNQTWYQNGKLHRDNDQPAIIYPNGKKEWYQNGKLHRDNDQPASITPSGNMKWAQNGKLHRINGPALIYNIKTSKLLHEKTSELKRINCKPVPPEQQCQEERWFQYGELHRENGPAVTLYDGTKAWVIHGKLHREDGPAYIHADGTEEWYLNDKVHRIDGPAITLYDGTKKMVS